MQHGRDCGAAIIPAGACVSLQVSLICVHEGLHCSRGRSMALRVAAAAEELQQLPVGNEGLSKRPQLWQSRHPLSTLNVLQQLQVPSSCTQAAVA